MADSPKFIFEQELSIKRPVQEVFEFFSRAENLEKITPSWLNFKILSPLPSELQRDKTIDYRLKLYGIPFNWKTKITVWEPPYRFVDIQLKGPYLSWVHEHRFFEEDQETVMSDRVEYQVPGGPLAPLIHKWFVQSRIQKIFQYRTKIILDLFNSNPKKS